MKFEDEFKKELNKISPTEEQCERIRSGVAKKLAESAPVKKKKPLYLRIAAVSGASICAAAVLIVVIFGIRGGNNFINSLMAPSESKGSITAGEGTGGANYSGAQDSSSKNDDVMSASYGSVSSSSPSHNAQGYPSSTGTSQVQRPSIEEPSGGISDTGGTSSDTFEPSSVGGETDSGGMSSDTSRPSGTAGGGGDEPPTGGGDEPPYSDEPAPTGGGGDEPAIGGGGEDPPMGAGGGDIFEIPDGYVALTFSEGNSICDVRIDNSGTSRTYRSAEDASAPPLSEDKVFKAISDTGSEFFAQFEDDKMFVYYTDGRVFNVYTVML